MGTDISPPKVYFEDDLPFPKVGYVSSLEGIKWDDPPSTLLGTHVSLISLHDDSSFPFLILVWGISFCEKGLDSRRND